MTTTTTREVRPSYFATYDYNELTGQVDVHYWYRSQRGKRAGKILPWPPRRSHFGVLYSKDIPADLTGEARDRWAQCWFNEMHVIRLSALREIEDRPDECAASFARLRACCCCCGKALDEPRSVAYGIGPECRTGMPPAMLTKISAIVARDRAASA